MSSSPPSGWQKAFDAARLKVEAAFDDLSDASAEKQKQFAVGKVAGQDVVLDAAPVDATVARPIWEADPDVLVRAGEIITEEHAARAAALGVLPRLVRAAAGSVAQDAYAGTVQRAAAAVSGAGADKGVRGAAHDRAAAAAVGRPAGQAVLAPDGTFLLSAGEIVTEATLERARLCGREGEVLAAAGLGAASETVDAVKEGAGKLWERVKQRAIELSEPDQRASYDVSDMEARVQHCVGRRVGRSILDHHDEVILLAGEEITPLAVERARAAGVLDILLKAIVD